MRNFLHELAHLLRLNKVELIHVFPDGSGVMVRCRKCGVQRRMK